mgnify:CR=1 FL=1
MPFSSPVRAACIPRAFLATAVGISAFTGVSLVAPPPAAAAACSYPTPDPLPSADGLIQDAADLQWLRDTSSAWSGSWTQTADIDMGDCEWDSSIGDSTTSFTGTYDGGGFAISGLTIDTGVLNYAGLFGRTDDASIQNLGFTGSVTGDRYVGGLIGYLNGGSVSNSYATGSIQATDDRGGGLIGGVNLGSVIDSYASGDVQGANGDVGGLIGYFNYFSGQGSVSGSYALGSATSAGDRVGGLVGSNNGASITNSFARGAAISTGDDQVGGLVGYMNGGAVTNSYATGNSEGSRWVGGLIGDMNEGLDGGSVSESYALGSATAAGDRVGGLVGSNSGASITNSFARGAVTSTGGNQVGGLVGYMVGGSVTNSYATGATQGNGNVGGLLGDSSSVVVTEAFWDIETSGLASSDGGTGKTTLEMKSLSTFSDAGWAITESCSSSSTWGICTEVNSGYPYLSALSALTPVAEPQGRFVDFTYLLPDGRECSSISPQRVQVGTMHVLPGEDALCQTSDGSLVAGWVIPVPQGFTGYGSVHEPFPPGLPVRVTDSQRFTLVPYEQTLQVDYDANIATDDACTSADVLHGSQDRRVEFVWVPRADFSMARTPSQAPCQPEGHELMGWNTSGDGTGEAIGLGEPLPEDWAAHRTNHHTLYATWRAA